MPQANLCSKPFIIFANINTIITSAWEGSSVCFPSPPACFLLGLELVKYIINPAFPFPPLPQSLWPFEVALIKCEGSQNAL